jgi:site-specific recombinase XerC
VPLSADEVAQFWNSFRTFRDLALVGLMLLDGLRSCEVLALRLEDLRLSQAHLLVLGKGNKKRVLPLPREISEVLEKYLRPERPLTNSCSLFVSLKGRRRGRALRYQAPIAKTWGLYRRPVGSRRNHGGEMRFGAEN